MADAPTNAGASFDNEQSPGLDDLLAQQAAMFDQFTKDVKQQIRENFQMNDWWSSMVGFYNAVDWTEPWLMALLALDLVILLAVVFTRKSVTSQMILLGLIGVIVTFSERLNAVLALHWEKFSTQNYFDEHGIFMVTVLCGPLVFAMFLQVVFYLFDSFNLLVKMKARQFKHEIKEKARKEREGATIGAEGPAHAAAAAVGNSSDSPTRQRAVKKRE